MPDYQFWFPVLALLIAAYTGIFAKKAGKFDHIADAPTARQRIAAAVVEIAHSDSRVCIGLFNMWTVYNKTNLG
jgi:hypothetical protein